MQRLEEDWKWYMANGAGDDALTKAIFSVFSRKLWVLTTAMFVVTMLGFLQPLLVLLLIDFITSGEAGQDWSSMSRGVYLAIMLTLVQFVMGFLERHVNYQQIKTGARAECMLIAMIYQKHAKVSDATRKEFSQGQIINLLTNDVGKMFGIIQRLSTVAMLPISFIITFAALFFYYGWTFLSGFIATLLAIVSQTIIAKWLGRINQEFKAREDERLKITTEALTHPKMLKLYSWVNHTIGRIKQKREQELVQVRREGWAQSWMSTCSSFWPSLLPVFVFGTYIGLGNNLTLGVATASLILFGKLAGPMVELPDYIKTYVQVRVANGRI